MKHFVSRSFNRLANHLSRWQDVVHQQSLLEVARQRLAVAGGLLFIGFIIVAVRLVDVMAFRNEPIALSAAVDCYSLKIPRADIVDRNNEVLATHLVTASIYANPKVIIDPREAAQKLHLLLPNINQEKLYKKLSSGKGFAWVARHVSPQTQQAFNKLGLPGVYLQKDYRRVYPYGNIASHILGYCGVDGKGLSGVEKFFDIKLGKQREQLKLSVDIRIQHLVQDELDKAVAEYGAVAGNVIVMDIKTGEILAMVSSPNFDPNLPNKNKSEETFNRNTLGVYEPGSTFKILNIAIALESGSATPNSLYDATKPVKIGRFTVTDFKGKHRFLSLTEAFIYSSNIAAIKIAQQFGMHTQKAYFEKFGVFKPATVEIPEIGQPLIPASWKPVTTMTAAYGYGVSVTPLQVLSIVGGIINDGKKPKPTLLFKQDIIPQGETSQGEESAPPIISSETAGYIRSFMRMNAKEGTAKKADIGKYGVFAKTGTAYQAKGGGYGQRKTRTNSCVGGFPYENPRYVFLVMLDDPKASKATYGYATAGWNAAPTAGKIIERMAPLLGLQPSNEEEEEENVPGWTQIQHVKLTPNP